MPHLAELAPPTAAEDHAAAIDAAQAIQNERHADTLGAMWRLRHNLGRVAVLVSNGAALVYGTTLSGVGWQAAPTGAVYEVAAGVVMGGGIYAAARLREHRNVRRAEERQDTVREALDEPVDLIKAGRRSTVLRWYGCDDQFLPEAAADDRRAAPKKLSPERTAQGLESIITFAKEAGITEIAVSAKVLDALPGNEARTFGKVIPNDDLLRQKRVKVHDRRVDEKVLRCDIAGAEALLGEIQDKVQQNSLKVVGDLLKQASANHPALAHIRTLLDKGHDNGVVAEAQRVLRGHIEQTASNGTAMVRHTDRTDGTTTLAREHTYARLRGPELDRVGITQARGAGGQQTHYKGLQSLLELTGFETIDALIADTKENRDALAAKNQLQERAEIAAWLLLQTSKPSTHEAAGQADTNGTRTAESTTLQRVAKESPRTAVRLRRTGKHNKEVPATIEYRKNGRPAMRARRTGVALGMLAATTGLALYAGHEAHHAINSNADSLQHQYAASHGYADGNIPYSAEDSYWHYVGHADSVRARIDQAYNAADTFDTSILDTMTAHLPSSVTKIVAPDADPAWIYRKESALHGMDNAYTGSSDRAGIGDVIVNQKETAWTLTPTNGVSTEGYWAQSMQSFVDASSEAGSLSGTPPYRGFGVEYDPTPYSPDQAQGGLSQRRILRLQNPETLSGDSGYIKVEGQKLFEPGLGAMSRVVLPNEYGQDNTYDAYALPVLIGGDIVAAKAEMYTLGDNKLIGEYGIKIVQLQNGMFYMTMDDSRLFNEPTYLQISYWVKPNAGTAIPVHADTPLSMPGGNGTTIPFTQGMSTEESLRVWRQLSGNSSATTLPTVEEAAAAVKRSKTYSFTPYEDARIALSANEPASPGEGLAAIGELSASLPTANCNVAATEEMLASRGQAADGRFANITTGYHNNGDDTLSTGEAHMWVTDNKGKIIDGTPLGQGRDSGDSEAFDPNANPTDDLLNKLEKGAEDVALAGLIFGLAGAGRKYGPVALERTRSIMVEAAAGKLRIDPLENPEAAANMHKLLNIVQWMHYAPTSSQLNEQDLPDYDGSQNLAKRYAAMPVMTAKQMRTRITQLQQTGRLAISDDTKRQLISLARNHKRVQATQKTA